MTTTGVPSTFKPLRIGDLAPNFSARTTRGPVQLSDFHGRWLVFFTHPADFTPVCTSEFVALAQRADQFEALNCALLGLSVDSLYSHLAWLRAINDRFGVEVGFPVIEDPTLEIAKAYGMVAPDAVDASSVRTTMFIDPNGLLRAATTYPLEVGRSVDEILRVLQALQRVSDAPLLTPANWTPGSDLLCVAEEEAGPVLRGNGATDWFFKPVPDTSA